MSEYLITKLLPPKAKAGECYARVWVKPTYRTNSETILVSEASEKVTTSPAQYETVTEEVLVKEARFYMEPVPAVYGTEKETRLVEEGQRLWKVGLERNAAPASDELLAAAKNHGINLDAATPGACYHEHYIPAQYETVTEQIIDNPAHPVWKKGTGPIQRIDEATGEIMCLVEVPATYKTISKRVLKLPAATRTVNVPAEYKTVKVRELVAGPEEIRNHVPAKYKSLSSQRKVADRSFVWHEIHNGEHPKSTRTGNKICLTETPPRYEPVTKTIVKSPAST